MNTKGIARIFMHSDIHVFESLKKVLLRFKEILVLPEFRVINL
jgi:hypothetical protein